MTATRSSCPTLLIVSLRDDLHAQVAKMDVEARGRIRCELVASDGLAGSGGLTWDLDDIAAARLPLEGGGDIRLDRVDAIWWRRHPKRQIPLPGIDDPSEEEVIDHDCYTALVGLVETSFDGRWISSPVATSRAENKLIQLRVARQVGLTVPATLVSQDPSAIRTFHDRHHGDVIVKAVRGTHRVPMLAQVLTQEHLQRQAGLRAAPAIFQERVPGDRHLRVVVLGERVVAAELRCSDLDWRPRLDSPIRPVELVDDLNSQLVLLVARLGLRMGVLDLKIDARTGMPVFLEINPQGQFFFVEGLGGGDMRTPLTEFLEHETLAAARERVATGV